MAAEGSPANMKGCIAAARGIVGDDVVVHEHQTGRSLEGPNECATPATHEQRLGEALQPKPHRSRRDWRPVAERATGRRRPTGMGRGRGTTPSVVALFRTPIASASRKCNGTV